ncbi:MAG: haloacid dehalogenase type II [Nitrososphaerota archaeon]|nr:haloacid dehalogenase type II [Candidatus Calditenuis fumarioli]
MIELLAFDVYGTLYDLNSLASALRGVVPEPQEFLRVWRAKQLEYTHLLSLMERYENFWVVTEWALRYTARRFGVSLDRQQERRLMEAWLNLRPHEDAVEALPELARRFRLVALTNGDRGMVDELLRNTGLRKHFTELLSAEMVRVYKPSPRVYGLVDRFGVARSEVGFVSSNPWDLAGAGAAGLFTVYLNRYNLPMEELGVEARIEVRDLKELAEVIQHRP